MQRAIEPPARAVDRRSSKEDECDPKPQHDDHARAYSVAGSACSQKVYQVEQEQSDADHRCPGESQRNDQDGPPRRRIVVANDSVRPRDHIDPAAYPRRSDQDDCDEERDEVREIKHTRTVPR